MQFSQHLPSPFLLLVALSMGGGADNDAAVYDGDGGNDKGYVAQALLSLALGRYSVQVGRLWRVFYFDFLYHDIPLIEEDSHHLNEPPRQNIQFNRGPLG